MHNIYYIYSTLVEKILTSSSTKAAIKEWLKVHKISFEEIMLNNKLFQIITRIKPKKSYIGDQFTEYYGHRLLCLPPYHLIFIPIELIWAIVKNYYNRYSGRGGYSNQNCLNLWKEALSKITPSVCISLIRHIEEEIDKWYNLEQVFNRLEINSLIINLTSISESDSD
ncbi:uncharacterized protein LOC143191000 [Rhynchophorus ferrugineus]|uniref:uncharacterized protein LOC143191000 n=1 Tax=Rhynchophorus ferrugineus TaxID=354439 RepID=UPI003FCCAEFC